MKITARTIEDIVMRRVRPLVARVNNVIGRGVVTSIDDTTGLARGQSTTGADQIADDIEFITPYGLSFRPTAGAETLVWSVGASARHLLAMVFDRRVRLKGTLEEGEVALHIGKAGQVVHLKADGSVEVRSKTGDGDVAGGSVVLKANGDVVITPATGRFVYLGEDGAVKKVALADDVDARLATLQAAHDAHVHAGVTAGPGSTAVPTALVGALAPTGAQLVRGK